MLKTKEEIKAWLEEYSIKNYFIRDNLIVDVADNVNISNKGLLDIPIQFGTIKGYFNCSQNSLTSCKGFPEFVERDLNCSDNKITSLEGCTQNMIGLICNYNQLTSLKGAPQNCEHIFCLGNWLTSLNGCPKYLKSFNCSNNQLSSLVGGPKEVELNFYCSSNHLTNLQGSPELVGECFICEYNLITDLSNFSCKFGDYFQHIAACPKNMIPNFEDFYTKDFYLNDEGEQEIIYILNKEYQELMAIILKNKLEKQLSKENTEETKNKRPKI